MNSQARVEELRVERMVAVPSFEPKLLDGCRLRLESIDRSLPLAGIPTLPVKAKLLLRLDKVLPSPVVLNPDLRESTMLGWLEDSL